MSLQNEEIITAYEARLYGIYLLEFILSNRIFDIAQLNFYDLGLSEDQVEIGLEHLTVTQFLNREKPNARFIN